MKTPQELAKLIGTRLPQTDQERQRRDILTNAPSGKVMIRLWEVMQETYGRQWESSNGSTPTKTWERLLTGISPDQIADGLDRMLDRASSFPPNGAEFRNLCLGRSVDSKGRDTTTDHKSAAYLYIGDPKHPTNDPASPEYVSRPSMGIESDEFKKKRKKAGNSALKDMMSGL